MNLGKAPEEYKKMKEDCPDEILLYQIGTFFKIMHEDARKVAEPLGLKLFVTGEAENPVPVCGFPKSGLDKYVGKLARAGFSTAVCRQRKDESGGVHRGLSERIRLAAAPNGGAPSPDGSARPEPEVRTEAAADDPDNPTTVGTAGLPPRQRQ